MKTYTQLPICPYCGFEDYDWWDGTTLLSDGDSETVKCDRCERKYIITIGISYDFTTEKETSKELIKEE